MRDRPRRRSNQYNTTLFTETTECSWHDAVLSRRTFTFHTLSSHVGFRVVPRRGSDEVIRTSLLATGGTDKPPALIYRRQFMERAGRRVVSPPRDGGGIEGRGSWGPKVEEREGGRDVDRPVWWIYQTGGYQVSGPDGVAFVVMDISLSRPAVWQCRGYRWLLDCCAMGGCHCR